jgi:hypothetical protein
MKPICDACGLLEGERFWRGGEAWLCRVCDLPRDLTITPEMNQAWKAYTAELVAARRRNELQAGGA